MELFTTFDPSNPPDEMAVRRLAYAACDGDSLTLLTTLLRTVRDLAEQLGQFYGTSADDVLRMETYLPVAR
jgi:hypothetical protein